MVPHAVTPSIALETLLENLVDYAGLFPPAALDMAAAVAEFDRASRSANRRVLARFVVPAGRLEEFIRAMEQHPEARGWRLSALIGEDLPGDLLHIAAANAYFGRIGSGHEVDCVECRAATPQQATERLTLIPATFLRFVEFAASAEPGPFLDAIEAADAFAKLRMGGITAGAFPPAAHVARFLEACIARRVAFKATAGLHHPLRGAYRLTYAPDADRAGMYGYLNLFLAAALLRAGGSEPETHALLMEHEPSAFRITDDAIHWGAHRFSTSALAELRRETALGVGSCSFQEPLDDLHALGFR